MKKIAVILSGCGVLDGSEIQESVLSLLAISRYGYEYQCFAPNIEQTNVINHLTGKETTEKRNVLIESARIARGDIKSLDEYTVEDFSALILPGGFGVVKNLSNFALQNKNFVIDKAVNEALINTVKAGIPIGALCISPILLTKTCKGSSLTTGNDSDIAKTIEELGCIHKKTKQGEILVDKKNKVVSTSCYMLDGSISDIYSGIDKCIEEVICMID